MKWINKIMKEGANELKITPKKIKSNLSTVVDTQSKLGCFPAKNGNVFQKPKSRNSYNYIKCHVSRNKILQTTVVAKPRAAVSI